MYLNFLLLQRWGIRMTKLLNLQNVHRNTEINSKINLQGHIWEIHFLRIFTLAKQITWIYALLHVQSPWTKKIKVNILPERIPYLLPLTLVNSSNMLLPLKFLYSLWMISRLFYLAIRDPHAHLSFSHFVISFSPTCAIYEKILSTLFFI